MNVAGVTALRISEALNADIEDLDTERGHRTMRIVRKGGKQATVPLAPRRSRALDLCSVSAAAVRSSSPAMGGGWTVARRIGSSSGWLGGPGSPRQISPSSLRHTFITLALDAGVVLRDVQDCAGGRLALSYVDPRTTMRYDRGRQSLDRHATYLVAAFDAGASRTR